MAIPLSDWLDEAKRCPLGTRRKVTHSCGEGRPMLVGNEPSYYWCKCFRCNDGGHYDKQMTAEELRAVLEADTAFVESPELFYSKSATDNLPELAAVYLAQRGVTIDTALKRGVRYDTETGRLLFPQFHEESGKIIHMNARLMGWTRGDKQSKFIQLGATGESAPLVINTCEENNLNDDIVVLTEDMLSSWNISRACDSSSVIGTNITDRQLCSLDGYSTVVTWLDGDRAGIDGAARVRNRLELIGKQVVDIRTPLDPKYYSLAELHAIIRGINGRKVTEDIEIQRRTETARWVSRPQVSRLRNISYH